MRIIPIKVVGHTKAKLRPSPIVEKDHCPVGKPHSLGSCKGCHKFEGFEDWENIRCAA